MEPALGRDDVTATVNGLMDEVERMMADYGSGGGGLFGGNELVKQDFKYCRNFAEPFARNYQMARPEGEETPVERAVPPSPPPPPPPRNDQPAVRPGDVPGAPVPN